MLYVGKLLPANSVGADCMSSPHHSVNTQMSDTPVPADNSTCRILVKDLLCLKM